MTSKLKTFFISFVLSSGAFLQTVVVSDNINDTTGNISSVLDVKSTSRACWCLE